MAVTLPSVSALTATEHARFFAKVRAVPTGCWLWTGARDRGGYGRFLLRRRRDGAHRVAYEALTGPIPSGLDLDHLCRVRGCVNPAHMEPVTRQVNVLRGDTVAARRAAVTHCNNGHPYDAANTYRNRYGRHCRACGRMWTKAYLERKRARLAS